MPLYDYVCYQCGHSFELLRRLSQDDAEITCPECGSARIQRVPSTFAAGGCGSSGAGRFR